jgi:hypothetical protein
MTALELYDIIYTIKYSDRNKHWNYNFENIIRFDPFANITSFNGALYVFSGLGNDRIRSVLRQMRDSGFDISRFKDLM